MNPGKLKFLGIWGLVLVLIVMLGSLELGAKGEIVDQETYREVELYFSNPQASYLRTENRKVQKENLYLNTLQELIAGPTSNNLVGTIPENTRILGVYEKDDGLFIVDFSENLVEEHWGGTAGEGITIYSIVNTLTSFPEIDAVKFKIEGEERDTLAGHWDLTLLFTYNEDMVEKESQ